MIDLDDQVVETVVPAQPIAWFIGRLTEGAVIAAVRGILAPGIVATDPTHRQQGPRPSQPGPPWGGATQWPFSSMCPASSQWGIPRIEPL